MKKLTLFILFWLYCYMQCFSQMIINPFVFNNYNTPVLDDYPAIAAYSLRKINTSYTGNCIQVFNVNTASTSNIGFSNNILDTVALKNFCPGSNTCYVRTFYDQSGNSRDLIQTASLNMPIIVNSGAINYVNGMPSILFDGVNDFFRLTFTIGTTLSRFAVVTHYSAQDNNAVMLDDFNADRAYLNFPSTSTFRIFSVSAGVSVTPVSNNTQLITYNQFSAANSSITVNGVESTGTLPTVTYAGLTVGRRGGISGQTYHANFDLQELIYYNTSQSSNRLNILNNMNIYYRTY